MVTADARPTCERCLRPKEPSRSAWIKDMDALCNRRFEPEECDRLLLERAQTAERDANDALTELAGFRQMVFAALGEPWYSGAPGGSHMPDNEEMVAFVAEHRRNAETRGRERDALAAAGDALATEVEEWCWNLNLGHLHESSRISLDRWHALRSKDER